MTCEEQMHDIELRLFDLKSIANSKVLDITMPLETITESSLERILDKKLKPLENKMEGLVQSIELICAKYDEMLIKHKNMEVTVSELQRENDLLRNEVLVFRNRSEQIWDKIDDLEQYGRRDCEEIRGVSVQKDESTDELVHLIGNLVNINVKAEDLSVTHRLKSSTNQNFRLRLLRNSSDEK